MQKLLTASILFSSLIAATPSFAVSSSDASQEARRACTPDALRLCSQFIPDADKITTCMGAKKSQLSPACRAVFGKK